MFSLATPVPQVSRQMHQQQQKQRTPTRSGVRSPFGQLQNNVNQMPSKLFSMAKTPPARRPLHLRTTNATVKAVSKSATKFKQKPQAKMPHTPVAFKPLCLATDTERPVCSICGVGPLASMAQLHEHQRGKKHLHRVQKLALKAKRTPSKKARSQVNRHAQQAWSTIKKAPENNISRNVEAISACTVPIEKAVETDTAVKQSQDEEAQDATTAKAQPTVATGVALTPVQETTKVTLQRPIQSEGGCTSDKTETEVATAVAVCHAIVGTTGKACTLKAKANGRCGRHKAAKWAR